MNRIFQNKNLFFLVVILITSTLLTTAISISLIYNRAVRSLESTLTDVVMREKAFIEVFSKLYYTESQIVSILKNVKEIKPGIGKNGEFVICRMNNGQIDYLVMDKPGNKQIKIIDSIKSYSPILRALNGESGFYKGFDSKNVKVYSAYAFIPALNWGIVAKVPVAEFNETYVQAGIFALMLALTLISLCIYLFIKITDPVIKSITNNEAKLSLLFNNSADAILIHDLYGKILDANETALNRLQYSKDELKKMKLEQIDAPEYSKQIPERFQKLLEEESSFFEAIHISKNNQEIPTEINAKIIDFEGKKAVLSIARDISRRKEVENSLRESEEKFRTLIEASIDAILLNEHNIFTFVNKAALKLFGAESPEQLIGKSPFDLFHPDYHELVKQRIKEMIEKGVSVSILEEKIVRLDGTNVDVEAAASPFTYKGKKSILVVLRDITERKAAEAEIQMSQFILKQQNEEFLTLNEELNESNKQIQKINDDLLISKQKAEESDKLKTAFLQNISHEIRTPLNAIMGFSELMQENIHKPEKLMKFSGVIFSRSNDLLEIINEILDIAKIESGQLTVNIHECKLDELFEDLSTYFAEHKMLDLKRHIKLKLIPAHFRILTDSIKLKQIFINLIGNAFKFTNEGFIEVGCKSFDGRRIVFYVKDTGIGIPKEKQHVIFERFVQINSNASKVYGGTGLGLPIVKGLLEILNGEIWLESEENKGTTFYFSFPAVEIKNKIDGVKKIPDTSSDFSLKGNVLLVEDDEFNAEFIFELLKDSELNLTRCKYGKEAIELALNLNFDIVLLDIRLPDIEGYEVCRKIKQVKRDIKIIAQTAYAASYDEDKALQAGCDDYISKPIRKELLYEKIRDILVELK